MSAGDGDTTVAPEPPLALDVEPPPFEEPQGTATSRRRTLALVSSAPELNGSFLRELRDDLDVILRDSLAQARASGDAGLALRLSGVSRPISVEVYETLMPSCEAAATADLVRLPEGVTLLAKTVRQKAPQCGEALELAGQLLAVEVGRRVRRELDG